MLFRVASCCFMLFHGVSDCFKLLFSILLHVGSCGLTLFQVVSDCFMLPQHVVSWFIVGSCCFGLLMCFRWFHVSSCFFVLFHGVSGRLMLVSCCFMLFQVVSGFSLV